jgi:Leucine-rich repeat (LRR) protein
MFKNLVTLLLSMSFLFSFNGKEIQSNRAQTKADFDCLYVLDVSVVECEALVAIYNATGGDNWINHSGWLEDSFVSNWYGIVLDNNNFISTLNLRSNNLAGTLPESIGNFNNIEYLDLSVNQIYGTIPPELFSLTTLVELNLSGNDLSGNIPNAIGDLNNLTKLDLSFNQLSGDIPRNIGNLTSLSEFSARDNEITGSLPSEIGSLEYLRLLSLSYNHDLPPKN